MVVTIRDLFFQLLVCIGVYQDDQFRLLDTRNRQSWILHGFKLFIKSAIFVWEINSPDECLLDDVNENDVKRGGTMLDTDDDCNCPQVHLAAVFDE